MIGSLDYVSSVALVASLFLYAFGVILGLIYYFHTPKTDQNMYSEEFHQKFALKFVIWVCFEKGRYKLGTNEPFIVPRLPIEDRL